MVVTMVQLVHVQHTSMHTGMILQECIQQKSLLFKLFKLFFLVGNTSRNPFLVKPLANLSLPGRFRYCNSDSDMSL